MDPVTAFSLAAGVLQVIDVGFKAVKTCREFYKDGSLAEFRGVEEVTEALVKGSDRLNADISQSATPQSAGDDILELSNKCSKLARDLLEELGKLRPEREGVREALTKGFRALRRKALLKEKQELLEKYRRILDTRILVRLDARSLKDKQDIKNLDQGVQDLVLAVEQIRSTFKDLVTNEGQQIKDHFDDKFDNHARAQEKRQAHKIFCDSLFFPEIESRQEQVQEAFEGTCRWVFDSSASQQNNIRPWSNFRSWLEIGEGVYWISGKPGSGKSTLMKYIVGEDLTSQLLAGWSKGTKLLTISFFFWNTGSTLQKSCTGLLRSLLYQIAIQWPELIDSIEEQFSHARGEVEVSKRYLGTWTDQRLLSTIRKFFDKKPTSVSLCAFVDGLDEFVGDEDSLLNIVRLFEKAPGCKICVSSRPEQAFRQEFRPCPQLRVQDLNRDDIRDMATGKLIPSLQSYNCMSGNKDDVPPLLDDLIEKASGVFLWLDLMIKDLIKGARNGDTAKMLQSRLQRTPDTIHGMYTHILSELDSLYHEETLTFFAVLLAAGELDIEVTLLDLVCAEGEPWDQVNLLNLDYFTTSSFEEPIHRMENQLIACCGSLVDFQDCIHDEEREEMTLKHYDRHVIFGHRTAEEYLEQRLLD
ncbi:MAG: hypothetical protein Q9170_002112 [Blastenia crenularia]